MAAFLKQGLGKALARPGARLHCLQLWSLQTLALQGKHVSFHHRTSSWSKHKRILATVPCDNTWGTWFTQEGCTLTEWKETLKEYNKMLTVQPEKNCLLLLRGRSCHSRWLIDDYSPHICMGAPFCNQDKLIRTVVLLGYVLPLVNHFGNSGIRKCLFVPKYTNHIIQKHS